MASQIAFPEPAWTGRRVHHALGDGLRASLVRDPAGLVLIPLVLHFPNLALEALQARFADGLEQELARSPLVGLALSLGLGFALAGRLLGQALVIRRAAGLLSRGRARPLGEEFADVFACFPTFVVVFLVYWAAFLVGFVALVLPGLFVLYLWGFAAQAAAIERAGIADAFRRSRALVRGQTGRWLAGAALAVAGLAVAAAGAGFIWAGVREAFRGSVPFSLYLVAFGAVELVTVVFAAVWTALYLELDRARRARELAVPAGRQAAAAVFMAPPAEEREGGEARPA